MCQTLARISPSRTLSGTIRTGDGHFPSLSLKDTSFRHHSGSREVPWVSCVNPISKQNIKEEPDALIQKAESIPDKDRFRKYPGLKIKHRREREGKGLGKIIAVRYYG